MAAQSLGSLRSGGGMLGLCIKSNRYPVGRTTSIFPYARTYSFHTTNSRLPAIGLSVNNSPTAAQYESRTLHPPSGGIALAGYVRPSIACKTILKSLVQDRINQQWRHIHTTAALSSAPGPKKPNTVIKEPKHEQIYNLPNFLTAGRLIAAPVCGYLVLHDMHTAALTLLITAGITDVIDGWYARKYNLQTVVGSVVDPMADKMLMTILTVTLAMKGLLPVWLAVIILGRDVGLAVSAIWYRWISLPPPKTFMRYWDFSLPSAEVKPTTISKVNTLLQLGLITVSTAAPIFPIAEAAMMAAQGTVAVTTIWSGLSYVFSKNAVKILTQPQPDDEATRNEEKDKKGNSSGTST